MDSNSYTGVYFCKSTIGHHSALEFSERVSYAESYKTVSVVWYDLDISLSDLKFFTPLIKEKKINRIVIAVIQASLEIDDSGNKEYFVEKTDTIEGNMARFGKSFLILNYAAYIRSAEMVQVDQHPNIELLIFSY